MEIYSTTFREKNFKQSGKSITVLWRYRFYHGYLCDFSHDGCDDSHWCFCWVWLFRANDHSRRKIRRRYLFCHIWFHNRQDIHRCERLQVKPDKALDAYCPTLLVCNFRSDDPMAVWHGFITLLDAKIRGRTKFVQLFYALRFRQLFRLSDCKFGVGCWMVNPDRSFLVCLFARPNLFRKDNSQGRWHGRYFDHFNGDTLVCFQRNFWHVTAN